MSHNLMRDQRRGGQGTIRRRQRWRMRPTLLAEERSLLSTIVVNNPTDTPVAGHTDLRQAIVLANTNGGTETITFDKKVFATPQTISLNPALAPLELSDTTGPETITGPKAGVTVDGDYTAAGPANSVFKIDSGVTATLSGLTITGGNNGDYGGGVDNAGTATLTDCTISGNAGGGLDSSGTATLTGCTISGNPQGAVYSGGGVANFGGTMTLTDCTISGNSAGRGGGGVWSYGTTTLTGSTISGNSAYLGGGLINYGGATTLTNCTVSGNSASGGRRGRRPGQQYFFREGILTLTNCTVSDNSAELAAGWTTQRGHVDQLHHQQQPGHRQPVQLLHPRPGCRRRHLEFRRESRAYQQHALGNTAIGAAGASGVAAGDGHRRRSRSRTGAIATVTNTTFLGNLAIGGTGGAGADRRRRRRWRHRRGLHTGIGRLSDASSLALSGGLLIGNVAQGGAGG